MSLKTILTVAAGCLILEATSSAISHAEDERDGFNGIIGVRVIDIDHRVRHDTHPDDSFLPNASVKGSAGKTELGHAAFAFLGIGYRKFLRRNVSATIDVGALLGGGRDESKNANDSRADANGSFIYSKAHFGMLGALGVAYHINDFSLGGEVQLAGVQVESGWDRFDDDEEQDSEFKLFPSVGPKVGYDFTKRIGAEATLQIGESLAGGLNFRVGF